LTVDKLKTSVADGTLAGGARLDTKHPAPRGELNLSVAEVRLEELKRLDFRAPPVSGTLSARIALAGQGHSLHEMLASANGTVSAVIPSGAMRAALAEAASLDLAGALGIAAQSDKETHIRCGVASFDASDGVLTARTLLVDTDKALITGSGEIHMDSGALDLSLRGNPKHVSLTMHSPVSIRGTLNHPEVRLNAGKVLARGAAAAALGVVLTPVAAVLAYINPKVAHNADCADLTARAQTAPPEQPEAK